MQISYIDFPNASPNWHHLRFSQPVTLDEQACVLWSPDRMALGYGDPLREDGWNHVLPFQLANQLVRDTRHWRIEFTDFLARGGTLAVFLSPHVRIGLHTLQEIIAYDPDEALPEALRFPVRKRAPGAIVCHAGEPFRQFFDTWSHCFEATAALEPGAAQVMAVFADTGEPCALYTYEHPGRLLLLPALAPHASQQDLRGMVAALENMIMRLKQPGGVAGVEEEDLPEEAALRRELHALVVAQRDMALRQAVLSAQLEEVEVVKQLRNGGRNAVATAAARALRTLGAYVEEGLDQTDSMLFQFPARADAGLLMLVDENDAQQDSQRLENRIARETTALSLHLGCAVQPVLLYIGANRLPAEQRRAAAQALRARHPGCRTITGDDLLTAWSARDPGLF